MRRTLTLLTTMPRLSELSSNSARGGILSSLRHHLCFGVSRCSRPSWQQCKQLMCGVAWPPINRLNHVACCAIHVFCHALGGCCASPVRPSFVRWLPIGCRVGPFHCSFIWLLWLRMLIALLARGLHCIVHRRLRALSLLLLHLTRDETP